MRQSSHDTTHTHGNARRIRQQAFRLLENDDDLAQFHATLLDWYEQNGRDFPWRQARWAGAPAPEPYIVLISEVMLQQTQTRRVQEKLPLFLERFPTIFALAQADNAEVVRAWEGMGYNSRALRLRDCAKAVVERHSGVIPSAIEELRALPGIGAYTAAAIAVFAYGAEAPVVDVNIRRVYSRLTARRATTAETASPKESDNLAERLYARSRASSWHQAIMDIGASYCLARAPKCDICPIARFCLSAGAMTEAKKIKRPEPSHRGVPNRIWRGRIVQALRSLKAGEYIQAQKLYAQIFPDDGDQISTDDAARFLELLRALERDGIVETTFVSTSLSEAFSEPRFEIFSGVSARLRSA
jgi:A/G-specific adenine glycosylase